MKASHTIGGQWKCVCVLVVLCVFGLVCFFRFVSVPSIVVVSHVVRRWYAIGQANEAIFITSFAAESNINFQFSKCHLPWLTDIINRKCTKIPSNKFNFIWIPKCVCTHIRYLGYCFYLLLPFFLAFSFSRFGFPLGHRFPVEPRVSVFFHSFVCVLCTVLRSLLCNKSSICWFDIVRFICAETGRKLLWFVTNPMEMPSTMLSHFDMRWLCAGVTTTRAWHSFLMNTSGTWILWLQPCQRQQKHFTAQENCFLCYSHAHTTTIPFTAYHIQSSSPTFDSWFVLLSSLPSKTSQTTAFTLSARKQFDMIRLPIYWSWTSDVIDRIGRKLADYVAVSLEPCSAKTNCAKRGELQ